MNPQELKKKIKGCQAVTYNDLTRALGDAGFKSRWYFSKTDAGYVANLNICGEPLAGIVQLNCHIRGAEVKGRGGVYEERVHNDMQLFPTDELLDSPANMLGVNIAGRVVPRTIRGEMANSEKCFPKLRIHAVGQRRNLLGALEQATQAAYERMDVVEKLTETPTM